MGPKTKAAEILHKMKFRMPGENFRDVCNRIASALTETPDHYHRFRGILLDQRFMPAGRVQAGIGTTKQVTAYNCFVSGTILDSFTTGDGSIMQRAHEAAATMRMGGGIGYDFSPLRPRGDLITALQSQASGPVSFMRIYNEVGLVTASSGHRRGAQMGILRVDHPDIEEFILAKHNEDQLTGFNLSVAVTNEFMEAVESGKPFALRFGGKVHRTIDAQQLWELIMRSAWDWAEPGVIFIDNVNELNNLRYCETISATNPCSEQPLPPFGACLLGSFNLTKYLKLSNTISDVNEPRYSFDEAQFVKDIPVVVEAMDAVVDIARYPIPQQRAEAKRKRRIGLGITGLANAIEAMGHKYGSPGFIACTRSILNVLKNVAYEASAELARRKGPFPAFSMEYCEAPFIQGLDRSIQTAIKADGIRNSHLTSIAPTGTISMCADNISSALEPVWAYEYNRPIRTPEGIETVKIEDYGVKFLGVKGRLTDDVTAEEHIQVLSAVQKHVDSAVAKTCNVTGNMSWESFKGLYFSAWKNGAKCCSVFNKNGKRAGLLQDSNEVQECSGDRCAV